MERSCLSFTLRTTSAPPPVEETDKSLHASRIAVPVAIVFRTVQFTFSDTLATGRKSASTWAISTLDHWLSAADIRQGKLFRCVCRKGTVWGTEVTEKVVWHVVKEYARRLGISRTISEGHAPGSVMIQVVNWSRFNSYLDTSRCRLRRKYLGCKQRLHEAVNDRIGIEPGL